MCCRRPLLLPFVKPTCLICTVILFLTEDTVYTNHTVKDLRQGTPETTTPKISMLCQPSMRRFFLGLLAVSAPASAINLFVSSYDGNITTLSLTLHLSATPWPVQKPFGWPSSHPSPVPSTQWTWTLGVIDSFNTSTQSPSWLLLDKQNNILYLIDEATTSGNGTIITYSTSTGIPSQLQRIEALAGGVHAVFFNSGAALAVPHYTGSALEIYAISPTIPGDLKLLQSFVFTMPGPGPVLNRQDSPHPHETLLDPTGRFILVNDLGADLVRVFAIDATTNLLAEMDPLHAALGSGPRHAAFTSDSLSGKDGQDPSYIFYLAGEISATITAYRVSYPTAGGMAFTELPGAVYPTLGPGHPVPATTTGESTGVSAEIALSPDGRFVIASNRRDLSFNSTTRPATDIPSDSIGTWALTAGHSEVDVGDLNFMGLFPAGGSYARQFAINKAGNLVAVGLQESGRVVILERDVDAGSFVGQIALVEGLGEVTCVVWDE